MYTKLEAFGADKHLVSSVFTQLSHWICSLAMNQLVFRKDLCTFEKAIQIKHNVMDIKSWLEERKLDASSIEPLIQSSHLIMSKKTESNLEVLAGEMTSRLTSKQVISILTTYNPPDGFEEDSVDSNFIIKLSKRLEERDQKDNVSLIFKKFPRVLNHYNKTSTFRTLLSCLAHSWNRLKRRDLFIRRKTFKNWLYHHAWNWTLLLVLSNTGAIHLLTLNLQHSIHLLNCSQLYYLPVRSFNSFVDKFIECAYLFSVQLTCLLIKHKNV